MSDVKPGQVFVAGTSRDTARELLAAARGAGLDAAVVRTTAGGFIVPERIAPKPQGKTARALPVDPPPEPEPKKPSSASRTRRKKSTK